MPMTNVQTANIGGGLQMTYGDWTFTANAAADSIVVKGGRVYLAQFTSQDDPGPYDVVVRSSVSTSGSVTTVTVFAHEEVTTGRFMIIHK